MIIDKQIVRIQLDEQFSIRKRKDGKLWFLEYYRLGKDHMPDELYASRNIVNVIKYYIEVYEEVI